MELCIGDTFSLGRKIGSGTFGCVHLGTNVKTGGKIAIKLETTKAKSQTLQHEAELYNLLAGSNGVPALHWYGHWNGVGSYNVMVIDLMGPCLEGLLNACNRQFNLKTVLMLADQMISHMEYLHERNVIHRDIKPSNFVIGLGEKAHHLYIIDFGVATQYRDPKTQQHIPYAENKEVVGTAHFISANAHVGIEQSRRDDLEAIGYVLMYLAKGNLPWQGMRANSKRLLYEKIAEMKISTPVEELCRHFPCEFATYLSYCRTLHFEDQPDYTYLRSMMQSLNFNEGFEYDGVFEWTMRHSC